MKGIRKILILERNTFIRNTLLNILQCRFPDVIFKEELSFDECEIEMNAFKPDILFIGDIIKGGDGFERLHRLRVRCPTTVIILFMEYDIDEYRKEAVMAGVNHVISKELWTGSEILALVETILLTKNYPDRGGVEAQSIAEDILGHPIERRRKDTRGMTREKEYLAHHPDRRREI
jgi:DNA-binding NarL/FixJ family response regulator